jgi:tetratricopeptide (TPR) repeat protein
LKIYSFNTQDSLVSTINAIEDDRERLYIIEEALPNYVRIRDTEAHEFLFEKGFELAKNLKIDTSIAFLHMQKGNDEYFYGNYIRAKEFYQISIDKYSKIAEEIKTNRTKKTEANAYNNLGIILKKQSLYSQSLINLQIALSIRKSIKDSIQIANT